MERCGKCSGRPSRDCAIFWQLKARASHMQSPHPRGERVRVRVIPKMADNFDQTLDRCLDRIRSGEDIESILADYPGDTIRLRPLLRTTVETVQAYSYSPAAGAKRDARERFTAALTELRETRRQKQPWFKRAFVRPATWAAVATLVVAIVVAFVGVRPALSPLFSPGSQVLPIAPVTSAGGNFAFLISDEVNAIADF